MLSEGIAEVNTAKYTFMKISIITASYNSESTIEESILSVLEQDINRSLLEYIIIDGASTDKTLAIIDKYKNRISKIISEKDKGIYHALNRGLAMATGDVIDRKSVV